jgi:hypothetical protein
MSHLAGDTIGGFNGFIESQKAIDGKATLTTVLFDTSWRILHDGIDLREVKSMTSSDYVAGGGTAMLDAIGEIIGYVTELVKAKISVKIGEYNLEIAKVSKELDESPTELIGFKAPPQGEEYDEEY